MIFAVTFTVEAPDADEAHRRLRRMFRHLSAAELEERAHLEEVIGDPTLDEDWTLADVREALGV